MWQARHSSRDSDTPKDALHEATVLAFLSCRGLGFLAAGLCVGVLSGFFDPFGLGDGFIVVQALAIVGGMSMHHAIATSLLVIALICVSGVISFYIYLGMLSR